MIHLRSSIVMCTVQIKLQNISFLIWVKSVSLITAATINDGEDEGRQKGNKDSLLTSPSLPLKHHCGQISAFRFGP